MITAKSIHVLSYFSPGEIQSEHSNHYFVYFVNKLNIDLGEFKSIWLAHDLFHFNVYMTFLRLGSVFLISFLRHFICCVRSQPPSQSIDITFSAHDTFLE